MGKWAKGTAKRISGLNQAVEFALTGNELSISIGRERGNLGACLVDVYLDDVKYSQFSTYNELLLKTRSKTFTGNGSQVKFDLEECFSFDHVVTVGGTAKTGGLNIQGSGASIPTTDDFIIIRNYNATLNKVTHVLWFKVAPSGAIIITYKQGESIAYMRGTLGNVGQGFNSALESAFGDGSIAESTTEPAAVSSGLGFRETDDRSVVTFRFDETKTRKIKLVVAALDSRATGSTPFLDLNFVTNRMHRIMNAGIGGWSANLFLTSDVLINRIDEVANFAPDILLFESCTNDDWSTHLAKATVTRAGLTNAQVMSVETTNLYSIITGSANNKTVTDERIYITAVTRNSITLESSVNDTNIVNGDAVIIGSYGGNHKRVAVRKVKSYNSSTKTITLDRAISVDDFYHCNVLDDLVGDYLLIKNAPSWVQQVTDCIAAVKDAKPLCKVFLATAGIPNYNHRRLFGYRELAQKLAGDKGWGFVDFYKATFDFQYSQDQSVTVKTITSTGASEYSLDTAAPRMLYNPVVLVNGVEHKQCRIVGGYGYQWAADQSNPNLDNDVLTDYNYRIIFDKFIPAVGASIVVKRASKTWSTDYTHPINLVSPGQSGRTIFGDTSALILNK
ncbi:hypothetical protein [Acinetobacter genomosp. 15BJ]|uniref:Uncharacterized protein n=1 Tax=Acinetobacter genomosp. 15BJ TaxID=106651 RepID=A0ABT8V2D5_9GAMM|nr:hypothetical protein [Acinetobacter genomosp. 15BJ]MDO3658366.1 hypothetical protein [Acinetobacter genomosp. 15BJ]